MRLKFLALVSILSLISLAEAQPGPTLVQCIDAMAINSKFVFVGQIVDICGLPFCSADNNVTVKVEKYLKGNEDDVFQFRVNAPMNALLDWKDRGSRLLLFDGGEVGADGGTKQIDLSDPELKVLTADMNILTTPQQVLLEVQNAIDRHPNVYGIFTVRRSVPLEAARKLGAAFLPVTDVPVDADLERWAQSAFRPRSAARDPERDEAVHALAFFKSDENERILKSLLGDSSWVYGKRAAENMGVELRVYLIRKDAYQVLKDWDVSVTEPVTTEETSKPQDVTVVDLSNKAGFVHHADIDALMRFPNLQVLILRNDHEMTDEAFRSIGALKDLRNLELAGSTVNDDRLSYLTGLNRLESLDLGSTKITDTGLATISGLPSLKHLYLARTRITPDAIAELHNRRPDLEIQTK
jgi:hypothetical protein